jgi:hypothetical protein
MVVEEDQRSGSSRLQSPELLAAHEKLESRAWELSTSLMDEQQEAQLRDAIRTWRAANPEVRAVALVHFTDFRRCLGPTRRFMSRGLLGSLGIDPTGGLDPQPMLRKGLADYLVVRIILAFAGAVRTALRVWRAPSVHPPPEQKRHSRVQSG